MRILESVAIFLLQGIFPTQGQETGTPLSQMGCPLSHAWQQRRRVLVVCRDSTPTGPPKMASMWGKEGGGDRDHSVCCNSPLKGSPSDTSQTPLQGLPSPRPWACAPSPLLTSPLPSGWPLPSPVPPLTAFPNFSPLQGARMSTL